MTTPDHDIIEHQHELGFTIVAKPDAYGVEYVLYDIVGWEVGEGLGEFDKPLWLKVGVWNSYDVVNTLAESEPYMHGTVKWDGCSDWCFDQQEHVMLHACDRQGLLRIGQALARCWDWTAELCPRWDPC
jgi:hypothetical protein